MARGMGLLSCRDDPSSEAGLGEKPYERAGKPQDSTGEADGRDALLRKDRYYYYNI